MIKFLCAFGANAFSMQLVPITHAEVARMRLNAGEQPTDREYQDAYDNPNGWSYIETLKKAASICDGGTVQFAPTA